MTGLLGCVHAVTSHYMWVEDDAQSWEGQGVGLGGVEEVDYVVEIATNNGRESVKGDKFISIVLPGVLISGSWNRVVPLHRGVLISGG